jgi:putative FmdB family regulatory protein
MFDFLCPACQNQFEELVFGDEKASCPKCGEQHIERMLSAPSPLKTGVFPYKVGPVHSRVGMSSQSASCQSSCSGSCSSES